MPAGRPSEYKPEYCKQIIEHCTNGNTITSFAKEIGVWRSTLYYWAENYPEFSDAIKEAKKAQADALFELGFEGMRGKIQGFNSTVWVFMMKNVADWRDKKESNVKVTGLSEALDQLPE